MIDPQPYDGPIARIDGQRPFNGHLWPLDEDWYWANRAFGHRIDSRFNFAVWALADGRYATTGTVSNIEGKFPDIYGTAPVVFESREKAVRISAARFIRLVRNARRWIGPHGLDQEHASSVINWALEIARRPPVKLRPLPQPEPPRRTEGLPLFDHGVPA